MSAETSVIVGRSAAMERVRVWVMKTAKSPVPALIRGDSGTGKELVARALHRQSPRSAGPFVVVDLGGIAGGIAESELFGHVQGAYTGALSDRMGAFRQADGGVLFLDELGNAPLEVQAKLLRALERREVIAVGSTTPVPVDIRVVAATNANLPRMVREGQLRKDLLFRLDVLHCTLPSLRERLEDLEDLVPHLLVRASAAYAIESGGSPGNMKLAPEVWEALRMHGWPGNVRELYSYLWRAVTLLQGGGVIQVEHLRLSEGNSWALQTSAPARANVAFSRSEHHPPAVASPALWTSPNGEFMTWEEARRAHVQAALDAVGGNVTRAAVLLGVKRSTLQHRIKVLGVQVPPRNRV